MFIAGACTTANQNQLSKLIGTDFFRMNNLPVGIHLASCGSFNQTGIVCGDKNCYSVTKDGFTKTLPLTTYSHANGDVVGFQTKAVIFGGTASDAYYTEQYDPISNSWSVVNSQKAFGGSPYYHFSAVATENAIYSFGGANHQNQIFTMSSDFVWNLHSQTLITGRSVHKAMINGEINV